MNAFVGCVAPQLGADPLVHALGKGLGDAVGERLEQDRRIVVVVRLEPFRDLDLLGPSGDDEPADPVGDTRVDRGDVVAEAQVGLAVALGGLLADAVQAGPLGRAGLVGVHDDVVAVGLGRPEPDDGLRAEPPFGHDLVEHRQSVVVERLGSVGELGIGEHLGELAANPPGAEERRPVDVGHQLGDVVLVEHLRADERRLGDRGVIEGGVESVGTGDVDRHPVALDGGTGVRLADAVVIGGELVEEPGALGVRQQRRDHARGSAGVADVHDRSVVGGIDPQAGVQPARGGTADQQRRGEAEALHLAGHPHHLVERRRDQPGESDDVGVVFLGGIEDRLRRHHHPEVDHVVVRAAEHHAHDVLADVVDVALHRGEQHGAGLRRCTVFAFGFDVRREVGNGLLHDAGRLDHLREEHLAGTEQVADGVHAAHQRAFDHVDGTARGGARLLDVGFDEHGDAVDQRMVDALLDVPPAPLGCGGIDRLGAVAGEASCRLEEAFGGVVAAGEHDVFAQLAQLGVDLVVHGELAGVDDAHPHACFDRTQQEHRVHCFAHRLVAAERERQVRHTAGDVDVREFVGDLLGGFEEVEAVAVVLFDAGGDGEDVGVDDDVFGREPDLVDQQVICPAGDVDLALDGVGLTDFVEGHHDDRRAVVEAGACLFEELRFAFLHRDRVDDRLALHALQTRLDHLELRGVDHDRDLRDVGLRCDQVEERGHRLDTVDQAVVHVDVDDLRAVLHLLERDLERFAVLVVLDQATELGRARDVGAFADVDEGDVVGERERLQAGEFEPVRAGRHRDVAPWPRPTSRSRGCAPAWCRSNRRRR